MKKKLLSMVSAMLIVSALSVLATGGEAVNYIIEVFENEEESNGGLILEEVPLNIERVSKQAIEDGSESEMDIIMQRMKDNGAYYDEIKGALEKYIDIDANYTLSDNEKITLLNLAYKEYDFEKVLDVYSFIKLTDLDETDLEAMYLLAEKSDTEESIENAYAIYTNRVEDELTVSDVSYYVEKGITIDEILFAYELTLTGEKRIKTVLDEYLTGKSPGTIMAESYGFESDLFGAQTKFSEVLMVKTISKKTKYSMQKVIAFDEKGLLKINDDVMQEYTQSRVNGLHKKEKVGSFNNLDKLIKADLLNINGISLEEAQQLANKGYKVREIEKAAKNDEICVSGKSLQIISAE